MKTSWQLLAEMLSPALDAGDPLLAHALVTPPAWRRLAALPLRRWSRAAAPALALAALVAIALPLTPATIDTLCLFGGLAVLLPLTPGLALGLWSVPLGLALGPVLAREREQHTWELLRATPIDVEQLVLSEACGALAWLQGPIRAARTVLAAVSLGVALIAFMVIQQDRAAQVHTLPDAALRIATVGGAVLAGVLYLADRAQQLAVMALAALGISATARESRSALPGAVAAAFLIWLIDLSLAALVVAQGPPGGVGSAGIRSMALIALGPLGAYLLEWSLTRALLAALLTLLAREIAAGALWRLTLRAARRA